MLPANTTKLGKDSFAIGYKESRKPTVVLRKFLSKPSQTFYQGFQTDIKIPSLFWILQDHPKMDQYQPLPLDLHTCFKSMHDGVLRYTQDIIDLEVINKSLYLHNTTMLGTIYILTHSKNNSWR